MTTKILQPGDAMQGTPEAPFVIAPAFSRIFAERAERFLSLAEGAGVPHPQAEWLRFLATLTAAQQFAAATVAECELPSPDAREQARQHLMPPLSCASLTRDPAWQKAFHAVLEYLQKNGSNATSAPSTSPVMSTILERLQKSSVSALETLATKVINHELGDESDRAASVFIGAALQVYWTALAARLAPDALVRLDNKGLCPCCGSLPVASVVHTGGDALAVEGLRYLHCSLCNTEWNLVRVTCASCDDNAGIAYQSLQGAHPAVRVETCEACKGYLKIIYREKDPQADPVADDLATLALDLLIDEAGYERAGPNLFLLSGA